MVQPVCVAEGELAVAVDHIAADLGLRSAWAEPVGVALGLVTEALRYSGLTRAFGQSTAQDHRETPQPQTVHSDAYRAF
jgi:hypothetical protein